MSNALTSSEHLSNLALLRNCSTGHFTTQPSQPTWTLKLLLFGPKSITQFYLNYCTWGLTHLTEITHVPYGDSQAETGEEEEKSGPYFQHHSLQKGKYQRRKYRICSLSCLDHRHRLLAPCDWLTDCQPFMHCTPPPNHCLLPHDRLELTKAVEIDKYHTSGHIVYAKFGVCTIS